MNVNVRDMKQTGRVGWPLALLLALASAQGCGKSTVREVDASNDREVPTDDAGDLPKPADAGPDAHGGTGGAGTGGAGTGGTGGTGTGGTGGAGTGGTGGAGTGGTGGNGRESCARDDTNSAGGLEIVTLSTTCAASDGDSFSSRLTPDGRYVVFDSDAGDLVRGDTNGSSDAFLFNLETRALELITMRRGSEESSLGNTFLPVLSDDARYVAFLSDAFDLTLPTPTDSIIQIFVRDRTTASTRLLAPDYACAQWIDMSGDGAFLVAEGNTRCDGGREPSEFDSALEYRLPSGNMRHLGDNSGDNYQPELSRDGRFILWATRPPMTRGMRTSQLQLFDRETDSVETLPFFGFHYNSLAISDTGEVIAFAENQQVYRYNRTTDELTVVSKTASNAVGDGWSDDISMSGDGRLIAFRSRATNLVANDTNGVADILLYDADQGTLQRISDAPDGTQAGGDSRSPSISGDGTKVAFTSKARNLLPGATTGNYQLFVRTL